MNWEQEWKKIEEGNREDLTNYLTTKVKPAKRSKHPLVQIRNGLIWNAAFGVIITIGYLYIMFMYPYWQVLLSFSVVVIFNILVLVMGLKALAKIPRTITADHSLLEEMEHHHATVSEWIRVQLYLGRFVFPFAAAAGFMVGGIAGSGKDLDLLFSKNLFWIAMIISMIVLTFAGDWLARLLVKISFQKHLDRLKENIDQLKKD